MHTAGEDGGAVHTAGDDGGRCTQLEFTYLFASMRTKHWESSLYQFPPM